MKKCMSAKDVYAMKMLELIKENGGNEKEAYFKLQESGYYPKKRTEFWFKGGWRYWTDVRIMEYKPFNEEEEERLAELIIDFANEKLDEELRKLKF